MARSGEGPRPGTACIAFAPGDGASAEADHQKSSMRGRGLADRADRPIGAFRPTTAKPFLAHRGRSARGLRRRRPKGSRTHGGGDVAANPCLRMTAGPNVKRPTGRMSLLASVQRIRLLGSECRQILFSELDHGADADVFFSKIAAAVRRRSTALFSDYGVLLGGSQKFLFSDKGFSFLANCLPR